MKIYYFYIREKQKVLFFKEEVGIRKIYTQSSKKSLGNACSPTIQIQISMWLLTAVLIKGEER